MGDFFKMRDFEKLWKEKNKIESLEALALACT